MIRSVGKLNVMNLISNCMPLLGTADLGMGRFVTPYRTLGDEIHTQEFGLPQDCWSMWKPHSKDSFYVSPFIAGEAEDYLQYIYIYMQYNRVCLMANRATSCT